MKFLIYPLFFTISISLVGMQVATKRLGASKVALLKYSNLLNKSEELDVIRKKFDIKNSPQEVRDISQGMITIKEEISLGRRYGVCHNYAFTKLMGIVGKAPKVLNITGTIDYYEGATQITDSEFVESGVNILDFFDVLGVNTFRQMGDIVVYVSGEKEKDLLHRITHTGIFIGDDYVESKWGPIPAVFEHPLRCVPACFGNHIMYARLKMSGPELLEAVQKRLDQNTVKEEYQKHACHNQQELFDLIKRYEHNESVENIYEIYKHLEMNMNVQINLTDQNGLTPSMHAERIGCDELQQLFEAYENNKE